MKVALFTNTSEEANIVKKILNPKLTVINNHCNCQLDNFDLLVSYCYKDRIDSNIFSQPKYGGINFHPAPLPKYRGFAVYNFGILNEETEWGVTVHMLEQAFDTGDILLQKKISMEKNETAISLRNKSHQTMIKMIPEVINNFKDLYDNRKPQTGESNYYSKKMMNSERAVTPTDDEKTIRKKIRAFWHPPYPGVYIEN